MLDPRAVVEDWAPEGAPPPLPGQGLSDYLDKILGGEGEAKNEPDVRDKREYIDGDHNKTTQWEEGSSNFSITVVDGSCPSGVKPHYIVGNCLAEDNVTVDENCTVIDIIDRLWRIRKTHWTSLQAREKAYATLWNHWATKVEAEWSDILYNGWLCPGPLAHDELRRLLSLQKYKYYSALLFGSAATGAVVASLEYGIVKSSTGLSIGWVPWVNTAVGGAIIVFAATEFSRMRGGEVFSGLVLFGWGGHQAQIARRNRARLSSVVSSAAGGAGTLIGEGGGSQGGGSQGGGADQGTIELTCVAPEHMVEAASDARNLGAASLAQEAGQTAFGLQSADEANSRLTSESGECR
ncbi:MAG: hypothetical protein Q9209_000971 [Squamulea sp. 1 TL-2023]